ncbi:MAG: hypothetical protein K8I02_01405, partial [Candidatus Methylomirabilis sp.]|nr:hypothetical protein [Deltaproteobacteria bacterium]
DDAAIAQALAPFARPAGRLFLVEARVWEGDPERRARAWIAARARPLEAAAFAGVKVTLYSGLRPEAEGASGP